jgi:hypothetical protein
MVGVHADVRNVYRRRRKGGGGGGRRKRKAQTRRTTPTTAFVVFDVRTESETGGNEEEKHKE